MLHLDEAALQGLNITAGDCIAMLERLITAAGQGRAFSAPKSVLTPPDGRYVMSTLAMMDDPPLMATKSLILNDANRAKGLLPINALVSVSDGETGVPLATMDGNWITGIRTAALSALAAKHMVNPAAEVIGFVGTGVQARSHLDLFAQMFPLKHAVIYGRGQANIDLLCAQARALGMTCEVVPTPRDALGDVDIAVTSVTHTGVEGPFLDAGWLRAGCFAAIVDLAVPWIKESFAGLDRLIIDDLEQEAALPNKLADPAHVHGDLAGLVAGNVQGRGDRQDRTAFAFRGHALGDLALAALAYLKHQGRA